MSELESGHPDELKQKLANWLKEASDPMGNLPDGMTPTEWAARQFIDTWRTPIRAAIDAIEDCLAKATDAIQQGKTEEAQKLIATARQLIGEDIRDHLGIYEWNREGS